jgi:hypothetical protein
MTTAYWLRAARSALLALVTATMAFTADAQSNTLRCPVTESIAVGSARTDSVGFHSCQQEPGYTQYYRVAVGPQHANQTIRFDLKAGGREPNRRLTLAILDAQGEQIALAGPALIGDSYHNAAWPLGYRVEASLAAGTHLVRVRTLEAEYAQGFELAVTSEARGTCADTASNAIRLGETRTATLAMNGCVHYERGREIGQSPYRHVYRLELPTRRQIQVDVDSAEFEATVAVYYRGTDVDLRTGQQLGGIYLKGRAGVNELDRGARYVGTHGGAAEPTAWIMVSSEKPLETGSYRLSVRETERRAARFCSKERTFFEGGMFEETLDTVRVGVPRTGSLSSEDCELGVGAQYGQYFLVNWSPQHQNYRMTLRAQGFTPRLLFLDSDFRIVTSAVGTGGGDATLAGYLPQGRYYVVVSSAEAWGSGSYELALGPEASGVDPAKASSQACRSARNPELFKGYVQDFVGDDCQLRDGSYAHQYSFTPPRATRMGFEIQGVSVNVAAALYDTTNTMLAGDMLSDKRGVLRRLYFEEALTPRRHFLRVYALPPTLGDTSVSALGKYTVAFREMPPSDAPQRQCKLKDTRLTVAVGQTLNGRISTESCHLRFEGQYANHHRLTVATAATVKIDASAPAADVDLALFDAAGERLAASTEEGSLFDPSIRRTLPAGTYYVTVSAKGGSLGEYTLKVQ